MREPYFGWYNLTQGTCEWRQEDKSFGTGYRRLHVETCTPKKVGYVRLSVSRVEAADALMATVVPALADGAKLARLRVWAPESLVPGWARAEGTSQASGTKRSRDTHEPGNINLERRF